MLLLIFHLSAQGLQFWSGGYLLQNCFQFALPLLCLSMITWQRDLRAVAHGSHWCPTHHLTYLIYCAIVCKTVYLFASLQWLLLHGRTEGVSGLSTVELDFITLLFSACCFEMVFGPGGYRYHPSCTVFYYLLCPYFLFEMPMRTKLHRYHHYQSCILLPCTCMLFVMWLEWRLGIKVVLHFNSVHEIHKIKYLCEYQ